MVIGFKKNKFIRGVCVASVNANRLIIWLLCFVVFNVKTVKNVEMCHVLSGVRSCYDEGKRTAETLTMDYHRGAGVEVSLFVIFIGHLFSSKYSCTSFISRQKDSLYFFPKAYFHIIN